MKLFYLPGACSLAPHIVLEWIGEPYELLRVERGKTQDPEFLKINPLGKVPALIEDDGRILTEAGAILLYLAEKYPEHKLGSDSSLFDHYEMHHWISHFGANVHPLFYPFFAPQRYIADENAHDAVREAACKQIDTQLQFLEECMTGKDHVLGNRRTILDAYLFVFLRWSKMMPKPLTDYPNLYRFLEQMATDPGVKRALEQQKIGV
jgi:glutathione S-transferase